jgi:predicted outer membrane repeat protein
MVAQFTFTNPILLSSTLYSMVKITQGDVLTFTGNKALQGNGGGLYLYNSQVFINDTTLQYCSAGLAGGGVYG